MSAWMAFVIVLGTASHSEPLTPMVNAWPSPAENNHSPLQVELNKNTDPKAKFNMEMSAAKPETIGKMTGVEADTFVNTPTVSTVGFDTEDLCRAAVLVLQKQVGILSVSCVQTGKQ